jgi:homogentisate 1,2-dioxygenase
MDIPWVRGRVATQAHVGLPEGTVEEEYGRNGFFGRYAHLYRRHAPVGWTRIEGPLRPRAFDLKKSDGPILGNDDVLVSVLRVFQPMRAFARNADADVILFVHEGAGRIESDFGPLAYEPGDYLLIPRGTTHRLAPTSPSWMLAIACTSEVRFPDKGMLGQHALFDPAVVRVPAPEASTLEADENGEWRVDVLHRGQTTRIFYPFNPLDVVGWKGTTSLAQINVRDIRPVLSDRYHVPPSAHTTFVANNVVVCTFAPRPLENGDEAALKVPFYHANIDFDEVLFYHAGEFFSRQGISPGMMTFHPQGIHHGPQPGAQERSKAATRTEEIAVMIDARRPLDVLTEAGEIADYWQSWRRP